MNMLQSLGLYGINKGNSLFCENKTSKLKIHVCCLKSDSHVKQLNKSVLSTKNLDEQ